MKNKIMEVLNIIFEKQNNNICPSVASIMKSTEYNKIEIHKIKKKLYELGIIVNRNKQTLIQINDFNLVKEIINNYFGIAKKEKAIHEIIIINKESDRVTILGRDLYEFLGIKENYSDWIKRMVSYGFIENIDYIAISEKREIGIGKGLSNHQLTLEMAKHISMIQRNQKGMEARNYFIECEKKLKSINVPKSYAEALLEAGRIALENERLQKERDNAIATKAWISDKKTATAMVTASHLKRENNKLREEIGFCKKHATIKRMEILTKDKYRFKILKDFCKAKELEITKVPDVNYGFVNAYPADAWYNCYDIDLEVLFK